MRGIGYLLGLLLLVDAVPTIFSPQFWMRYTERNLKGHLPGSVTQTVLAFERLPDEALRSKALIEVFVGLWLIFLASLVPTRYVAFKGGGPPPMFKRHHAHHGPAISEESADEEEESV